MSLSKSFIDFRDANRYFLYGLSKSQVKLEFDRFLFFETCRSLKLLGQLKIDRSEINKFLDEIERGTKNGTNIWFKTKKATLKQKLKPCISIH